MIIVEGPDGAGKSTLVKWLNEQIEDSFVTRWNIPPKTKRQLDRNLEVSWLLIKCGKSIIQDRSPWITEPIYNALKNGTNRKCTWLPYQMQLNSLQPIIIYCRPPYEVIREHAATGSSPLDTPKYLKWIGTNIDKLIALYDSFFAPMESFVYDWTKLDRSAKENLLQNIKNKKEVENDHGN
jgi:hypothetical protein